jgi:cytochrome c nitrite reductase small subunit
MNPIKPMLVASVLVGAAFGIGSYTFVYAKGASYLSDDPAACANCHVMGDHLAAWTKSSHRAVATCNNCHTPAGTVAKYLTKAENGFWHSFGFTTGNFPDPLQITHRNSQVTEQACRTCHADVARAVEGTSHEVPAQRPAANDETSCVRCHASVGHWIR